MSCGKGTMYSTLQNRIRTITQNWFLSEDVLEKAAKKVELLDDRILYLNIQH
jgi:hypothetical protein